ncbi:FAD-dependent monooxygenase [Hydrogenophaga sp. NFH-34]|uniref:FAD-dependent monooxygenase n=1 Tax=Hydrogenophaga sp. NFH-34 TaxID=2744446 RepID=UPI001F26BC14|nr:FAD-dependent monooxygenase [Hydrogenophaga sp. NFH-34]
MISSPSRPGAPRRYDVVIRGAGVVGQTLALLLARERLKVALVSPPRATPGTPDVRAYALNTAARDLLRSVRAWPEASAPHSGAAADASVTPVTAMAVHGDQGGELHFDASALGTDALTWIVDVPALEQRLADAVHFQAGIDRLDAPPTLPAPLTVVCEGRRSSTRAEWGIDYDTHPYPHKAIAARLTCERPHGGVARQWFRDGEVMALLPLGGAQGNSVALVWSVQAQRADTWLAAGPEALAEAVQERAGQTLGNMTLQSAPQAWPLELARARRWIATQGRASVVLAGDAAHAMHPLAGQGLNVGLADAAELARVLHGREFWRELGDPRLLRRYERARQADVGAMSRLTDGLFSLFAQPDARVQALRNWGLRSVDRLGPLKHWLARQAMGQHAL